MDKLYSPLQCCAKMETSDLSMEILHLRVVWRYAGMRPGALCVTDSGQDLMHKWPADSLDTLQLVCIWENLLLFADTPYEHDHCMKFNTISTPYNKFTATIITHIFSGATVFYNAFFGQGFGPIFLDDLLCTSREARLIDCPRSTSTGVGDIDFCRGHLDDAGLRCVAGTLS